MNPVGRTAVVTVLGVLLAPLGVVLTPGLVGPASAAVAGSYDPRYVAGSLAGPGAVIVGADWDVDHDPEAAGNQPLSRIDYVINEAGQRVTGGAGFASGVGNGMAFPAVGSSHAVLTTGLIDYADDPDANTDPPAPSPAPDPHDKAAAYVTSYKRLSSGVEGQRPADYDQTVLRVDLDVPGTANCLAFDFKLYSEEYPDRFYNDGFIAELDGSEWYTDHVNAGELTFPTIVPGRRNFARPPGGGVVNVATSFPGSGSSVEGNAAGTTYDGATPLLTAATPVTPGRHSLYLSLFDVGDAIFDSAAFVDNLRVGWVEDEAHCERGARLKTWDFTATPATAELPVGEVHTVDLQLDEVASGEGADDAELLITVSGANPGTLRTTTNGSGHAAYSWTGLNAGTDTLAACGDLDADGECDADEPVTSATVTWEAPATVSPPRLAFTDDSDALHLIGVQRQADEETTRFFFDPPLRSYLPATEGFRAGPDHEGEAGGVPGRYPAYVSTRDHPNGEVYRVVRDTSERLTCHPAVETHPVVGPNGEVAYASNADGDWDIYVTHFVPEGPSFRPPPAWALKGAAPAHQARARAGAPVLATAPVRAATPVLATAPVRAATPVRASAPAAAAAACDTSLTTTKVTFDTGGPADDVWPAWTPAGDLVFARQAPGARPDLYLSRRSGVAWAAPTPLTSTPGISEAQPAVASFGCQPSDEFCEGPAARTWVVFQSDQFRTDGGLTLLSLADPGRAYDAGGPVQGSEPAFDALYNPRHLAFRSTEGDPFGAIWVAELAPPDGEGEPAPRIGAADEIRSPWSGQSLSHPYWLGGFDPDTQTATLAVTVRSTERGELERYLHADVTDVNPVDGSGRRVIRQASEVVDGELRYRYDEAGPAYSPDGARIVYSSDVYVPDEEDPEAEVEGARVLMVANADGTDAEPLLPTAQREVGDVDLDPAWSPDGTKVAFVRLRGMPEPGPPRIWVYDLLTRTATQVTSTSAADLHPSWSPDSRWLVISRALEGSEGGVQADAARRWGYLPPVRDPQLWVLDATRPTEPGRPVVLPTLLECPSCVTRVRGREPEWSPVSDTVVYVDRGMLRTIALDPGVSATSPVWVAGEPTAVTGHQGRLGNGAPTPARARVSVTDDPVWSPDGDEIAFSGQLAGQPDQRDIWAIRPDGTGLRQITDDRGPDTEPAWQRRRADLRVTVSVLSPSVLVGEEQTVTYAVSNLGASPSSARLTTSITPGGSVAAVAPPPGCAADGTGCTVASLAPGATLVYRVRLTYPTPLTSSVAGTVAGNVPDSAPGDNTDSTTYEVRAPLADLSVRIATDEPVGYVGGQRVATLTVRNDGPQPADGASLQATWPPLVTPVSLPADPSPAGVLHACLAAGGTCPLGALPAGAEQSFEVPLTMVRAGGARIVARVASATADPDPADNVATLRMPVLQPRLLVLPGVGKRGQVVYGYGEDMPPGSEITLVWDRGLTPHKGPFRVEADGTVRVPLPLLRRDRLGWRVLTATSTTALFTAVTTEALVVSRSLGPPDFATRP